MRGLTGRSLVTSALLLAVVVGGFVVMAVSVNRLEAAGRAGAHSTQVQATANALEKTTLDLETGLRGFLLTGKPRFLQPYRKALSQYPRLGRQFEALTAGDARQRARAVAIVAAVRAYARGWAAPLIAKAGQDLAAARLAEASGGGKARVDAIRERFAAFGRTQARIDAQRNGHAVWLGTLALGLALGCMGLSGLLLVLFGVGLRRTVVEPVKRLAAAVERVARGELSVRVERGGAAEVGELAAGFNAMAESLELQRDELENQKAELEAQQIEVEQALQAVEEEKQQSDLLRRFGDELAGASGIDHVAEVALRAVGDVAGAEIGALYVVDERSGTYGLVGRRGLASADLVPTLEVGDGLAGRALAERRAISLSYGSAGLRLPGLVSGRDAAHELHLPLLYGERAIGVVSLGRARDVAFGRADLELLELLAQRAAVVVAEALSLQSTERLAHELETLLGSTDEGIFGIDLEGRITFLNRAALAHTGYESAEELRGRDAHALLHHSRPGGSPYPEAECPIRAAIAAGEACRVEDECFWRKDGTPLAVEFSASPVRDGEDVVGGVVTFSDITARRRLERQRDVQHAVARVLAETSSTEDALPRLLAVVCEGFGWPLGLAWQPDGERLRCAAVHAASGFEQAAEQRAAIGADRGAGAVGVAAVRGEATVQETPAVAGCTVAVGVPIVAHGGDLLGVAEFYGRDVPAEEGLLGTLGSIAGQVAQFIERKRAEARSERLRKEFVATVSHELRTPLTAIEGWLDVLLSEEPGGLNEEQRRFLGTVKRNSERLHRLVDDLLVARQVETGTLSLDFEELDLDDLLRETLELVHASAEAKGIELDATLDGSAPVRGDRTRLLQLFDNLLTNAVKFTPSGGRVEVRLAAHGDRCEVEVKDSGVGIPEAERQQLFQPFFRASSAKEHGIGGTGLGLAISKAIAEGHGGDIRLGESDGPGTCFVVELPLRVREEVSL
jgi:PAS domain S-box-containing protein